MTRPQDLLPHREPFLFVTRIQDVAEGSANAEWNVTGDEPWLKGHFPTQPLVPGVLLAEALAQTAGIALSKLPQFEGATNRSGALVRVELRFDTPVRPPIAVQLHAVRVGGIGSLHQFDVSATVPHGVAARGSLVLSVPATGAAPTSA